ncbi:chromatin assembly factor 1 subunit A [Microdochium nivale]|nr:chromatin assembly factor 1 subunit A [Microdochium nivale]
MSEQMSLDEVATLSRPGPEPQSPITVNSPSSATDDDLSEREVSPPAGYSPISKPTLPLSEKNTNLPVGQASLPESELQAYTQSKLAASHISTPTSDPDTAAQLTDTPKMAPKRKLTQAEKEAQEKERELKKQKRADETQAKEAAKATKAAEKAKMDAEKEAKRAAKAAEKAEVEAKKEVARKQKEEQEQALLRKKAKQQNMLAAFVKRAPTTPSKPASTPDIPALAIEGSASPSVAKIEPATPQLSSYNRTFQPFFVKHDVTMAPPPFLMDSATKDAKSVILDDFIYKKRDPVVLSPLNLAEIFQVHGFLKPRGVVPQSVREIMETANNVLIKSESQTTNEMQNAQQRLNRITMKALKFYEDVRPPYIGTITTPMHISALRRLSKSPTGRSLNMLNYDYESEAEWQDDDGEDLMSEDEEEELEGEDELDDFLDDSDDPMPIARPAFRGELEPNVVGICFEEKKGVAPNSMLGDYKMEFLLESLLNDSIDPFSSAYWEKPKKKTKEPATTLLAAATANSTANTMNPPPKHAFAVLIRSNGSGNGAPASTVPTVVDQKDMVSADILDDFKRAVISEGFREHTKLTIVDLLSKKFTSCTKPQVKKTLEHIAVRETVPGAAKSCKQWQLLPAFSV